MNLALNEQNQNFDFSKIVDPFDASVETIRYRISILVQFVVLLSFVFGSKTRLPNLRIAHGTAIEAILSFIFMKVDFRYIIAVFVVYLTAVVLFIMGNFEVRRKTHI